MTAERIGFCTPVIIISASKVQPLQPMKEAVVSPVLKFVAVQAPQLTHRKQNNHDDNDEND